MRAALRKIRKALGALLGGTTGAAVVEVAEAFDVTVDPTLAGAIAILLAAAGAYLAPANATKVPALDRAHAALRASGIDLNDVANVYVSADVVEVEQFARSHDGTVAVENDPVTGELRPVTATFTYPTGGLRV